MDAPRANIPRPAQSQNRLILGGVLAAGVVYYIYSRSSTKNVGDAASRAGDAAGKKLEQAGEKVGSQTLKEEGRGLQSKLH